MNTPKRTPAQQEFDVIVNTLLSSQGTNPEVIKQHIAKYAQLVDVSYSLARQAVIWSATEKLRESLSQI